MNLLFSSPFDTLVEKATSEDNIIGSDLSHLYFEISDAIKSKQVMPKNAIATLKKRLLHKNPNVVLLTLDLLDICIKNSGQHFLVQVASKDFVDSLAIVINESVGGSPQVRSKALAYLQNWGLSFKENMSLCYMTTVYEAFKGQGTKFPPIDKSIIGSAMIDTTTAPEWSDSEFCVRCRTRFSTFIRKHHCRNCGSTFCNECSSNKVALPHLGVMEEVRVCDGCFGKISSGVVNVFKDDLKNTSKEHHSDNELQKAIAASLEDASETKKSKKKSKKKSISFKDVEKTAAEREEEEFEAAIQASLLESKKVAVSNEAKLPPYPKLPQAELYTDQTQAHPIKPVQTLVPASVEEVVKQVQSLELSRTEIENLHLFSELVEKTDAQVALRGIQALNPIQLQNTYSAILPIGSKLYKNLEELESKRSYYEDLNKRVTEAVIWYEQTLQKQLSSRSNTYGGQPTYHQYQENVYAPHSDHGFALPPTPVMPAYGEFYNNRINELSHESRPPIYSAPPLESPGTGMEAAGAHTEPYRSEGYVLSQGQAYPQDNYAHGYSAQDSYAHGYAGQDSNAHGYVPQGYAPETGYAPYPSQEGYPPQFETAPYHMDPRVPGGAVDAVSHHAQPPQTQRVEPVEEKPLIEF